LVGVMRVLSVMSACVLATTLGGCAIFADPNAWPQKFKYADSANLASGANVRYVNDRLRDMPGREAPLATMCTEPAPDVAIAFGTSLGASASISGQGSGGFGAGTQEAALQLAGRTAGVLALRDGLYATCQAYANGALGQSAYALGLSQYGNLLVALTAHDPGFQPAATATSVTAVGPSISISPNNSAAPTVTITPNKTSAPALTPQAQPAVADADDLPPVIPVDVPGNQGQGAANPNPGLFTANDAAKHALLVACISEFDPTRLGARNVNGERWHNGVLTESFCHNYIKRFGFKLMVTLGK
jgi:hypothetical protein